MSASWTWGFDRLANSDPLVSGFARNQPRMRPVECIGRLQSADRPLCGNSSYASYDRFGPRLCENALSSGFIG
jgi:hypothetical protein